MVSTEETTNSTKADSSMFHIGKKDALFLISATGALILHAMIAWLPLERLEGFPLLYSNGPLFDDSYIFFSMSRGIADWLSGCNPTLTLSSGFQPLISLLYAPFFSLFWEHKELPIHCALSLNALLGFGAHVLLYSLLRKVVSRVSATYLLSVWIWSPYVMLETVNGMETPLAILLLLSTMSFYWRCCEKDTPPGMWAVLGCLIGTGFWARVDLALAGITIVLDQLWRALQNREHLGTLIMRRILPCSISALAVASPWIVFTIRTTGSIMPVSGSAVRHIADTFFDYSTPGSYSFVSLVLSYLTPEFLLLQPLTGLAGQYFWQLCVVALVVLGCVLCLRDKHLRTRFRPLWIFQLLMLTCYIPLIGGFWHFNRYLYPVYTLLLFLHAGTLRYLESTGKVKRPYFTIALCVLCIPYAVMYAAQYRTFFNHNTPARYLSLSLFARNKIPPQVTVGAFQSGCLSYWLNNKVLNLDGVINERAYSHLRDRTMDVYLQEEHVEYIVEEEFLFKMWDDFLGGQISNTYQMVYYKKEPMLPRLWSAVGVYKRTAARTAENAH